MGGPAPQPRFVNFFDIEANLLTISGRSSSFAPTNEVYIFTPTIDAIGHGSPLTFSINNEPNWASFDTVTGELTGTPTDIGTTSDIVITASDGITTTSLDSFNLTVFIINTPPPVATVDSDYSFTPIVIHPDDYDLVTLSVSGKPSWADFNSETSELSGTPTTSDIGTTSVNIRLYNGKYKWHYFDITVVRNNISPTFTNTAITSVNEDATYTYNITTNDVDGDSLTITATTTIPPWLTLTDHNDTTATLTGKPTNSEVGSHNVTLRVNDGMDDVQVSDGNGGTNTITVNVTFINDPPVITEGDAKMVAISEDTNLNFTLNATDLNGSNDTLTWSIGNAASHGIATVAGTGLSQVINYVPHHNFIGVDNFYVKVTDTSGATDSIRITVNITNPGNPNNPPVASNGTFTINEDSSLTNTLIATDTDLDSLTYIKVSVPNNGTVSITGSNNSFVYTPTIDFYGTDSFTFKVNDGTVDSSLKTVTITIIPIADTPTITLATTNEDLQTTSGLKISRHVNDGIEVTHFKITHIQYGKLYQNNGTTAINNGDFISIDEGYAGLKFTPTTNASIDGSFDVQSSQINDNNGLGGNIATAAITVNSVNDKPSFTASSPPPIIEDAGTQNIPNWITSFNPGPANES